MTRLHFRQPPKGSKVLVEVQSESRVNLWHDVYLDVNENVGCTCESYVFGHNPCRHMKEWASSYREPVAMNSKLAEQLLWILDSDFGWQPTQREIRTYMKGHPEVVERVRKEHEK
jgi:hypothetical protein